MTEILHAELYCEYYQAHIQREACWFVTAALKSYEHVAFDRTINVAESIFEFFVAPATESCFVELMNYFQEQGYVSGLIKLPNRLMDVMENV
jgi:hypothetical protein